MKNGKRSVFFLVYYRPLMQHFFKAFHMAGFLRMVIRYGYNFMRYQYGLLTAFEKNGHSICPGREPPHGGMSLRRTQIGLPCSRKSIAHSPSTTSVKTR